MQQDNSPVLDPPVQDKKWYSLRVISGKEKKIQERILAEVERSDWKNFIFSVIVPTEKVYKIRNGKKVMQERNLLPGYILIEALNGKLNGEVAKTIADITNVIHFLGKETPLPMTQVEANRLLGKVDESTEAGETLSEPFLIGETIKIIDGPFAEFIGDIQEVNEERKKLKVIVKIFGRGTEVELNFMQVEKIN
jgi:transcription termination/antitermination protein NusG